MIHFSGFPTYQELSAAIVRKVHLQAAFSSFAFTGEQIISVLVFGLPRSA
jgi:hypothetical protein